MRWRLSGLFWIAAVLLAGATNFVVKHTVQRLDNELNNARRKTIVEQKQIHDLTAEWTYLNQPELLSDLNRRYFGLGPLSPKQFQHSVDAIPLRPPPAPPEMPAEPPAAAVAAAPPATVAAVAMAAAAPAPGPIVPVAATSVVRAAAVAMPSPMPRPALPASAAPVAIVPAPAPSLDALFAQVSGER